MKSDIVKQIEELKRSLSAEKLELESRLAEINKMLDSFQVLGTPRSAKSKRGRKPGAKSIKTVKKATGKRAKAKRTGKKLSLKEAILQVTGKEPLSREVILDEIKKLGYTFKAKNPVNSLNTALYNKKMFQNFGGKFGPKK